MSSASLATWATLRSDRIKRLRAAHQAFGGTGPGRRWVTEELNHALILRLATEFQGFARDLHDETGRFVAQNLAPGDMQRQNLLRMPYVKARKLDQGNADPGTLGNDFGLFSLDLWPTLRMQNPNQAAGWNKKLAAMNTARNGIVHDDREKLARIQAEGWPLTLHTVDRWKSSLDGLARGMDRAVDGHLRLVFGTSPWKETT